MLLAPSRGGAPQLGETQSADQPSVGDPRYGPATAHPPGLGLSSPQPDAERLANWVRFLAPRSWA